MDRRTHLTETRPYAPILTLKQFIVIELSGPPTIQYINPLRLELHTIFLLLLHKVQTTPGKNMEQWQGGRSESGVSRIKLY